MRCLSHVALAVLVLPAISCADTPAQRTQPLGRDSSGIAIIEVPADILQQLPLRIVDTPSVKIGIAEGAEQDQLFQVRGVRQLSDGSILVLNAGTHEVRRYTADGRWMSSSGRRGGGPGEMQFPLFLASGDADTSLVFDLTRRAFHVVDPTGRIVDSRSLLTSISGFVGLLDATTAVVADPTVPRNIYNKVLTADVTIAIVDLLQSRRDTLLTLPGFQEYRYTHGELVRAVRVPFTTMPVVGVSEGQIYVADGQSPEIRIYGRDAQLRRIIRLGLAAVPVDAAEWERAARVVMESRARTATGEGRLTPAEVARQRAIFDAMPRQMTRPFFDRIYLGHGGNIWLRQFSPVQDEQRWILLDAQGRVPAVVVLPPSILVREISESWVLGQEADQLEVEYVVRYPLRRSP